MTRKDRDTEHSVIIVGGGPAGSILASFLARHGERVLVIEREIHPREHVGESLTPSVNEIFQKIGFLTKLEDAGFIHKPGAAWTSPNSPVGKFVSIRLSEFPIPGSLQDYAYNVERDVFDAMLLRHADAQGATVLQGVRVERVLFDGDRAIGVRAKLPDDSERDFLARIVVDASGRRCLVATQLGLKRKDPDFRQFSIYSWFRGVEPSPPGTEGMLFLHFLGLERAWAWQIPLRDGVFSFGIVTDKADWRRARASSELFFTSLASRNASLHHNLRHAERIRPWKTEGDFSYRVDKMVGPGWLMIGDAMQFVDPVFSTGVDVAAFSAFYASESIAAVLDGAPEERVFREYERRMRDGVDAWYDLISLFYKLQNLFTFFAVRKATRESVVRVLQGNLYQPDTLQRARQIVLLLRDAYEKVTADPANLLRPGALAREG